MTSDVISKKLTAMEIEYLQQRTEKGLVIDKMTNDKIVFFKKSGQDNLDVHNKTQKRRICNGIARFYIKIAQIYAAILKSINPVIKYKDEFGIEHIMQHTSKNKIPPNVHYTSTQINLCNRRMNALLNGQDYMNVEDKDIFVHPDICTVNIKNGKPMNAMHDEGMVEFSELFKDIYNYDIGKFDKMSDTMKQQHDKALTKFYNAYTGNSGSLPEHVRKFSDIKLKQFNQEKCKPSGDYNKKYKGSLSEELFERYAMHLRDMYVTVNKKQAKLIDVLKELFSVVSDKHGEKVIINPELKYKDLDEIIKKTQELLTELYVGCEEDFLKGITIFQEIIVYHNNKTNEQKSENIKKEFENVLVGEEKV